MIANMCMHMSIRMPTCMSMQHMDVQARTCMPTQIHTYTSEPCLPCGQYVSCGGDTWTSVSACVAPQTTATLCDSFSDWPVIYAAVLALGAT